MPDSKFIARKTNKMDEASFDSLKREGLALVQGLSGAIWTDYNVHDPGVTILEQLCYALTDLIYRTGFPIEDYLAEADGKMDLERLALHPPEQIFPCLPTTIGDYRTILLDATGDIANVWLGKASDPAYRGLYRMAIQLDQDSESKSREAVVDQVRRVYERHRNLCEDLEGITVVREVECELHAEIEVVGDPAPAEMLAQIYHDCSRRIIAGPTWSSFEEALKNGQSPEELFRGPLTIHGLLREEEADQHRTEVHTADLFPIVKAIHGVQNIRNLFLKKELEPREAGAGRDWPKVGYRLRLLQEGVPCTVKLIKDGRELPVRIQDVRAKYRTLKFKRQGLRRVAQDWSALFPRPQGHYRNLQEYSSVQSQFPFIYGINQYGVPASAPRDVKAKAAQLKAYLLLFEQLMANFTAQLHHLRTLFSSDTHPRRSYFFQALGNDAVPGIEALYTQPLSQVLARIFKKHDNYADRKSRLLDYLLALYGEKFTQHSLRHFNYYYTAQQVEDVIIENKFAFLHNIVKITRDRAGAFNDREPSWNTGNVSGLLRRVSLLLGFRHHVSRSLTMALLKQGLKLIPHDTYVRMKAGTHELTLIELDDIGERTRPTFDEIPTIGEDKTVRLRKLRRDIRPVVPVRHNVLSEALLRGGIDLTRYRLGSLTSEETYQLVFQPEGEGRWWYLGAYPDKPRGIQSANSLCRFLEHLNIESEGLHIVEHILLRPIGKTQHDDLAVPQGMDFYSFRLSVIFPAWTARCHDANFRMLAAETVQLNCPAHLYPECYWLSFDQMCTFERLYKQWLDVRVGEGRDVEAINTAARALILFLLERRPANAKAGGAQA